MSPRVVYVKPLNHGMWRIGQMHRGIIDAAEPHVTIYADGEAWHVVGGAGVEVLVDVAWGCCRARAWRRARRLALLALTETYERRRRRNAA